MAKKFRSEAQGEKVWYRVRPLWFLSKGAEKFDANGKKLIPVGDKGELITSADVVDKDGTPIPDRVEHYNNTQDAVQYKVKPENVRHILRQDLGEVYVGQDGESMLAAFVASNPYKDGSDRNAVLVRLVLTARGAQFYQELAEKLKPVSSAANDKAKRAMDRQGAQDILTSTTLTPEEKVAKMTAILNALGGKK